MILKYKVLSTPTRTKKGCLAVWALDTTPTRSTSTRRQPSWENRIAFSTERQWKPWISRNEARHHVHNKQSSSWDVTTHRLVPTNYAARGHSPEESNYQNENNFLFERHAYSGVQIEKNEMGGACSTYGGEERFIQGLGGKIWGKRTTWNT